MATIMIEPVGLEVVSLQARDGTPIRQLHMKDVNGDTYVMSLDERAANSAGLKMQGIGLVTPDGGAPIVGRPSSQG